ncbi:MAG: hypothetical protein JRI22_08950 [Deltaproteobacteria bacterium]|nr:hypothetical protein [Deltaproteobacteria bacterium]
MNYIVWLDIRERSRPLPGEKLGEEEKESMKSTWILAGEWFQINAGTAASGALSCLAGGAENVYWIPPADET